MADYRSISHSSALDRDHPPSQLRARLSWPECSNHRISRALYRIAPSTDAGGGRPAESL